MIEFIHPTDVYERLWANGSSPDLETFLTTAGNIDAAQLSRLARIDQAERWHRGERRVSEEYLDRFPSLQADIDSAVDLIYHEYLLREKLGERPSLADFTTRFPQHATALADQVGLHHALVDPSGNGGADATPATHESRDAQRGGALIRALPADFGRYRVLKLLGRGAMGTVYLAEDSQLGRNVALKLPRVDRDESPEALARFRREAQIAASFHHPNLCPIYDFGEHDGTLFPTMPCMTGLSLSTRLEAGPLPEQVAIQFALTIARAMSVAHRAGVVHRDLKPANILLREDDEPVVTDFGIARRNLELDPKLTGTGTLVGTLAYMAPEQLGSTGDVGPASDVYSLGVILYEMLTGRPPFAGSWQEVCERIRLQRAPAPSQHVPTLSPGLDLICLRALAKDPQDRFATMDALAEALAPLVEQDGISVIDGGTASWRPHWFTIVTVASAFIIVIAAMLAWRLANIRWARQQVPAIEKLAEAERFFEAYQLAGRVRKYAPGESKLTRLMPAISDTLSVASEPSGARVYLKPFDAGSSADSPAFALVGTTPFSDLEIARGSYVVRIEKDGFQPFQRTWSSMAGGGLVAPIVIPSTPLEVTLTPVGEAPAGMVFVPSCEYRLVSWRRPSDALVKLDGYFIDRCEVTNREYKEFVSAGGYLNERFWTQPFVKEGRTLSMDEAMRELVDRTGLPGPRGWSNQRFPDSKADHPVTGITWYEAAAYAAFRGKSLPSIFQWEKAARNGATSPFGLTMPWGQLQGSTAGRANLASGGTAPVGSFEFGMSPFGCFDMAGNVLEWCLNETSGGFIASGASWESLPYQFGYVGTYPGFHSSDGLGFRCVANPEGAMGDTGAMWIDINNEVPHYTPAPPAEVKAWFAHYQYEKTPLDASVVDVQENDAWRREKIVFSGSDGERALAYLYLPKHFPGPYQVIHFVPAGDVWYRLRSLPQSIENDYGAFIRSGRAVFSVVLEGIIERDLPTRWVPPTPESIEFVEEEARKVVDLRRGMDYLLARKDVDSNGVAFLQASAGSMTMALPAIDPRYGAVIFWGAGLDSKWEARVRPEASPIHFVPLIRTPKLLIHGRYDETTPVTTEAEPLFTLLSDPKRVVFFEGGHRPEPEFLVPEVNKWLDETLGPVRRK